MNLSSIGSLWVHIHANKSFFTRHTTVKVDFYFPYTHTQLQISAVDYKIHSFFWFRINSFWTRFVSFWTHTWLHSKIFVFMYTHTHTNKTFIVNLHATTPFPFFRSFYILCYLKINNLQNKKIMSKVGLERCHQGKSCWGLRHMPAVPGLLGLGWNHRGTSEAQDTLPETN